MMMNMLDKLRGGDLRSIGRSNEMIPRLEYTPEEEEVVIDALNDYLSHKSKIVRASALEALTDLALRNKSILKTVIKTIRFHAKTDSPAVQARGRKLLKRLKSRSTKG